MSNPLFYPTDKGYPEYKDPISYEELLDILFQLNPSDEKFKGMYMDRYSDPRNAIHHALLDLFTEVINRK